MCFRIRGIVELPRQKCPRHFPDYFFRFLNCSIHPLAAVCQNNFCPVGFQNIPSFQAHGLRHGQNQTISFCCRQGSKPDPRIAGGRFNDRRPRLQEACLLRVFNHVFCRPVFHASRWVHVFQLHQQPGFQTVFSFNIPNLHQGRTPDEFFHTLINLRHILLPSTVVFSPLYNCSSADLILRNSHLLNRIISGCF